MSHQDGRHPLVSIVTLNYNGRRFLPGLFRTLLACTYPNVEIWMVDNHSSDDSVAYVREHFPNVQILENPENYLFARGNNEGLRVVKGKYVCVINNDVEVAPDFIEPIIAAFEQNPRVAAAQPKILALQKRDYLEYSGACGGFIDWLGFPFVRGRIFRTIEKDEGQYDQPTALFWASGACVFFRKSALDDAGGFDEDFKIHMEEIDLCWRLRLRGWEVIAVPAAKIWHHVGGTLNQDSPWKMYWNYRNNLFLLIKNLAPLSLALRLPLRFPLDVLALLTETIRGRFANARAILRAYAWVIGHLGLILRKRRTVQQQRKIPEKAVLQRMYTGSIVFEYFILGRRHFSQLLFVNKLLARSAIQSLPIQNEPIVKPTGVTYSDE